jgi:hypothetical protein
MPLTAHEAPSCTFEASLAWREVLRLFPVKERWLDGNGFRIYYWTHPLYRKAISTPFRDRLALEWEGIKPPSQIDFSQLIFQAGFLGSSNFVLKDVGSPVFKLPEARGGLVNDYINSEVILDTEIEKRFKHSALMSLYNAERKYNLSLEINPTSNFENFYQMYLFTRQRLGVLPYPSNFFRELFNLRGEKLVIFSCNSSEGILGYLLCYLHGNEMISGHTVYDFSQRHKRISDYLYLRAFQWGRANGFSVYRFGADNVNQTSLIESKQKLGAIVRPQWDFRLHPKPIKEDRPSSPVRRLLRVTPMPLFRYSGNLTKLYFG